MVIEGKIQILDSEISNLVAKENASKIKDHFNGLTISGSINVIKMWNLKKKVFNNTCDQPSAKKDPSGNFITDKTSLLKLYKNEYMNRLSRKPPRSEYKDCQLLKEQLFEKRMQISSLIKSDNWKTEDILKVCR